MMSGRWRPTARGVRVWNPRTCWRFACQTLPLVTLERRPRIAGRRPIMNVQRRNRHRRAHASTCSKSGSRGFENPADGRFGLLLQGPSTAS